MSIFPVRNLAKYGVVTDPDPYDLPLEAWSLGVNARFLNGKVTRGPVFRGVKTLGTANPRFVAGATPATGTDLLFIGYRNGKVYRYSAGSETDYTISGYSVNDTEGVWSYARLANVFYVNRDDRPPWYLRPSDSQFQDLSAGGSPAWQTNWTAKLLRSCSGALVAFNVTKAGTNYPTMVKTSSIPTSGTIPASWDQTSPATLATENILAELEGSIIDAQTLGSDMYIYGADETWQMTFVADTNVWHYRRVFTSRGALNANCVIEINGTHVVFGTNDIWRHDGVSPQSIADGRVREFIFGSLNASQASRCFVAHNAILKEIMFCFVSGDRVVAFPTIAACNRSATWNYEHNIWTFDDLPLVYYAGRANLDTTYTYATAPQTYANIGGRYLDQEDTYRKSLCFVGDTNSTYNLTAKLYAFDPVGALSQVSSAVDLNATRNLYLERDGLDLDAVGADLTGYKICQTLWPQGRLDSNAASPTFTVGAADYFNQAAVFATPQTWDGNALYKLDFGRAGRYLAIHVSFPDYNYFSLSGFDIDLDTLGER